MKMPLRGFSDENTWSVLPYRIVAMRFRYERSWGFLHFIKYSFVHITSKHYAVLPLFVYSLNKIEAAVSSYSFINSMMRVLSV